MNLGFTGTRNGMTERQKEVVEALVRTLNPDCAVHGDCVGADTDFHAIVNRVKPDARTIGYPSTLVAQRAYNSLTLVHDPLPPLDRNWLIVDASDRMIACPHGHEEEQRSGTWATVRYARKQMKPLIIVWPDGRTTPEHP